MVFASRNRFHAVERPLLVLDAVGLGTFVVIGTTKALDFQLGFLGAALMGVMTCTAGGVIRDVLANQVPLILRKEVYASACLAGSLLLVALEKFRHPRPTAALLAAGTVITPCASWRSNTTGRYRDRSPVPDNNGRARRKNLSAARPSTF